MPISVPSYTIKVRGAIVRQFECESCSVEYFYRQVAEGESQDYVGVAACSNTKKAEKEAQSKLDHHLSDLDQAIPCPACGHIQSFMIEAARHNHLGWLSPVFFLLFGFGAVGSVFAIAAGLFLASEAIFLNDYRFAKMAVWIAVPSIAMLLTGFMIFKVKELISSRHDPNSTDRKKRIAQGRAIAGFDVEQACLIATKYPLVLVSIAATIGGLSFLVFVNGIVLRWVEMPLWVSFVALPMAAISYAAATMLHSEYQLRSN